MGLVGADSILGRQQAYLLSIVMVPTSSFCEGLKGKVRMCSFSLKSRKACGVNFSPGSFLF